MEAQILLERRLKYEKEMEDGSGSPADSSPLPDSLRHFFFQR
jgi:hypothetical protein